MLIRREDIEHYTIRKNNFESIVQWLERNNVICTPCRNNHSIWMILNVGDKEEEAVAYLSDTIVKIGNDFRIYSEKGFSIFLEKNKITL